jgi:hypothetical protein
VSERKVYIVAYGPNVVAIGKDYPCAPIAYSIEFQNGLAEYVLSTIHCLNYCYAAQRILRACSTHLYVDQTGLVKIYSRCVDRHVLAATGNEDAIVAEVAAATLRIYLHDPRIHTLRNLIVCRRLSGETLKLASDLIRGKGSELPSGVCQCEHQ